METRDNREGLGSARHDPEVDDRAEGSARLDLATRAWARGGTAFEVGAECHKERPRARRRAADSWDAAFLLSETFTQR